MARPHGNMMQHSIGMRPDDLTRLQQVAEAKGYALSTYMRLVLKNHIATLET
jgi:predicted DNA-binding protein